MKLDLSELMLRSFGWNEKLCLVISRLTEADRG